MKKQFSWDSGYAECKAIYKNKIFIGSAICHKDDEDFQSERVGLHLAEMRADLAILQYIRNVELKPAIETLLHIQSSFDRSKKYNPKSYESKFMRRQLHQLQNKLDAVNQEIANLKLQIKVYIKQKEKFYQKIRKDRQQKG